MLVLPGVGAFNTAIKNIKEQDVDSTILDFVKKGKLFLGICLGFQLLFDESNEFTKSRGLGLIKGKVSGIDNNKMIVPHIGWNKVISAKKKDDLINNNNDQNSFYFIHSFFSKPHFEHEISYYTQYKNFKFCSGVIKDNLYGIQFHPEKSGNNGINFLKNLVQKKL